MKRKVERTSKNHLKAKLDWREKLEKLETGKFTEEDLEKYAYEPPPMQVPAKRSSIR
jgi:hypothetical protein